MSQAEPSRELTLADLLAILAAADLTDVQRRDMSSAVRTVCRLIGRKPEDTPLHLRGLAKKLAGISPAAHGLSNGRWNNVRSLFRIALGHARPMMKGRSSAPLSPSWQAVLESLSDRTAQTRLTPLFRWLSARQIAPTAVGLQHLLAYQTELHESSLLHDPDCTWSLLARSWNKNGADRQWPPIEVASKRITYILPWSSFPPSLKADVDRWTDRLACRDFADDGPIKAAKPGTLRTREYQLRSFASALVHRGRNPGSLTSLRELVSADAFTDGLRFYLNRKGGDSSSAIHGMASMLLSVARHWVHADEATLKRMKTITAKLAVPEEGLTAKNRDRLRPLNDPFAVTKLLNLPFRLQTEADAGKLAPARAALLAQTAVAIEILLVAPVRRSNLAAIDIERHLLKVGSGLHLVIPKGEVKNTADLEFALPEETVDLIEWYKAKHRPVLASGGNTALFPGKAGPSKTGNSLGIRVSKIVWAYTGLKVNTHLFRHIGAKIYLDQNPGGYEVMRRVLAHKKMETTTRFYTGLENAAATKHFDDVILRLRRADANEVNRTRAAMPAQKKRWGDQQ